MKSTKAIYPAGKGPLGFPAPCGKVLVESSEEAMTPFGGFVPLAAFLKHSEVLENRAVNCPFQRSSPNARAPRDVLLSFALSALCDGSRFVRVQRLRHDPALPELFELVNLYPTIRRRVRDNLA